MRINNRIPSESDILDQTRNRIQHVSFIYDYCTALNEVTLWKQQQQNDKEGAWELEWWRAVKSVLSQLFHQSKTEIYSFWVLFLDSSLGSLWSYTSGNIHFRVRQFGRSLKTHCVCSAPVSHLIHHLSTAAPGKWKILQGQSCLMCVRKASGILLMLFVITRSCTVPSP